MKVFPCITDAVRDKGRIMGNSKSSLRILALVENNPYPFDCRVRPHMEALSEAGNQVTVISPRLKGQARYEIVNNVRVYRFFIPLTGTRAINFLFEFLYATIALTILTLWVWLRHGMDVLHIYNPPDTLFVAALLPKLARKIILYDLRDFAPELYLSKFETGIHAFYGSLIRLERLSCCFADHIVVVNESYRQIVIKRDRIPAVRVSVVRQGPDSNRIKPGQIDSELRSRAKIIIAYLGMISSQDGVDHLLRALSYLDQRFCHKDWLCIIIGGADKPGELEKLACELGIRERTWFTGLLPDEKWIPILSTADIGVEPAPANPLNDVSTMNKLMDYMVLGIPSVAYNLPEHRVTAGESARYAKPNDEIDFACQIARLIEDPDMRGRMGRIGRQRIEQELAWSFQKQRLLNIYAKIADDYRRS
jgi:glycosyltransferase involved in cell wall biosynthesis